MRKIYTPISILVAASIGLTGCHADSKTIPTASANAPSPEQLKIDEVNKHVRELTKRLFVAANNLRISSGERVNLSNTWAEGIGNARLRDISDPQTKIYGNYRNAVMYYKLVPVDANNYDQHYNAYSQFDDAFGDMYGSLYYGTFFVYDPTKVQDKTELLIRVHDFMAKLEHVQKVITQGLQVSFQGIDPKWKPIVESLHKKLSFENGEATKAHHDLVAIKKWIETNEKADFLLAPSRHSCQDLCIQAHHRVLVFLDNKRLLQVLHFLV